MRREAGGLGLDARWADDLHHALHGALTGETRRLLRGVRASHADVATCARAACTCSRASSPCPPDVPGHRFVVCSQNHDQIGNRALGERLRHLAGPTAQCAAAAVVLCSPARRCCSRARSGRRRRRSRTSSTRRRRRRWPLPSATAAGTEFAGFGWDPRLLPDPVDPTTLRVRGARLDELDEPDHARALALYRTLLRLRRDRPDLTDGRRQLVGTEVDEEQRLLVVRRAATAVAVNLSPEARTVPAAWFEPGAGAVLAATDAAAAVADDGSVRLPGGCTAIVTRKGGNADK